MFIGSIAVVYFATTADEIALYAKGDEVFVFYRMDKRCEKTRKYLAVLDPRHGGYRPRMGMAEGWVLARVMQDHDPVKRPGEVCVEYSWPHFYNKQGQATSSSTGWTEWFPTRYVLKAPPATGPRRPMLRPDYQPELAIIAFRWGGRDQISHCSQWGETGTSASDTFFSCFLDRSVHPSLQQDYEVWIVYIEDHSDMMKVSQTAHLVFGANHPARRAKNWCAMYFLYPTAFEESCVPTAQTGGDNGAGLVDQKSFFSYDEVSGTCWSANQVSTLFRTVSPVGVQELDLRPRALSSSS